MSAATIPGFTVTTSPGRDANGQVVLNVHLKAHRRLRVRMWIGGRLLRFAVWVLPEIARRELAARWIKETP